MFHKFTKKPMSVEAAQWDGSPEMAAIFVTELGGRADYYANTNELKIKGSQYDVWLLVHPNDWVVKGDVLMVYPPMIFAEEFDKEEKSKKEKK